MKNKFFSKTVLLLSVSLCAVNFLFGQFIRTNPIDVFKFDKDEFLLNGKPFQIIAGEMHPPRIPEQYWKHRIQMAKAMGCNTIALYVFWSYHEPEPGVFDFKTENRDLARFIRMAKDEGMWVILRPGPYSCGEWDFGGLPPYLLSVPDIKIRCMDSDYTKAVERYVKNLVLQIKELQVTQGGPILMLQLENEYGSYGNDRDYMFWLKDLWRENGIDIPFYTSDGVGYHWLEAGSLPDAATGLNPGVNANDFSVAAEVNPNVPSLCSELYTGWLTHWGEPSFQRGDSIALLNNVKWLMDNKKSFSLYVIHGGTNFGYWAGANSFGKDQYQPDITSYDYDAPINEMGQATPRYYALRNLLASYLPKKQKLPAVPAALPIIEIPEITFTSSSSVWDHLPVAIPSVQPKPMEMFGQKFGFILYRTTLTGHKKGTLLITALHDYATVFIDGKYIGKIDRSKGENSIELPASDSQNPQLNILVEGMGRINFAEYMIDRKGITDRISLNGMTLMNWQVFPLPFDENYVHGLPFSSEKASCPGIFFKGEFDLAALGDTYLDMSLWDKGIVWVNGHNLGRYWSIGPQQRLYCPAPWLKSGKNEIVIFDLHATEYKPIVGMKSME